MKSLHIPLIKRQFQLYLNRVVSYFLNHPSERESQAVGVRTVSDISVIILSGKALIAERKLTEQRQRI